MMMTDTASDLEKRLEALEERERNVALREQAVKVKSVHHDHYAKVDVSIGTMNKIIIALMLFIALLVALGMYMGRST